jgi:hypothetical protein
MTSSEEWSDELQLCLSRVEIDHTVVVRVVSALDELGVVFADILVDGPIHLLTGGRAVRDPCGGVRHWWDAGSCRMRNGRG